MIPHHLAQLARVLDLDVELVDGRRVRIEWNAPNRPVLCADVTARRLWLLEAHDGEETRETNPPSKKTRASALYEKWHGWAPELTLERRAVGGRPMYLGTVERIGYRSDKWEHKNHDYDHRFVSPARLCQLGELLRIDGGQLVVTERGIEG